MILHPDPSSILPQEKVGKGSSQRSSQLYAEIHAKIGRGIQTFPLFFAGKTRVHGFRAIFFFFQEERVLHHERKHIPQPENPSFRAMIRLKR